MKVVTICGSYKFKKEMVEIAELMTLKGNCILMPNDLTKTGEKIHININDQKNYEYIISILGDVNGDGKINYLDYVTVYNHIYKSKHPESSKKLLENEYLIAADTSLDGKISYLDYVKIYNKIKELKGGAS